MARRGGRLKNNKSFNAGHIRGQLVFHLNTQSLKGDCVCFFPLKRQESYYFRARSPGLCSSSSAEKQ